MKRLATFVFAFLLVSSLSFAQAGGADKPKSDKGATTTESGKKTKKAKKSKKSKKGAAETSTTPAPK